MSIGKNSFDFLLKSCGDLIDGKTLNSADIGIAFISVKAADAKLKTKLIPQDQLIRYNFLEVFVRLAAQKFVKSGICSTYSEALDRLFDEYLRPVFVTTDSNVWRRNVL
jgi:hypothetical protein